MTQFGFPLGGDLLDDRYATWDAAYVLGSLSSNERREYEAHLETCKRCRAAVAEISGIPTLLAMLDLEDVRALDEETSETPPLRPEVLESVLDKVRWRRRRSRWLTSAAVGVAAAILQGWFSRFPDMLLLLSEQGAVWAPYIVRKMDHAFLMGRKAKWADNGRLETRPSEIFRQHFLVAPYPEESVQRVVAEVGLDPIVFGSDFPHGEGLPDPAAYLGQLQGLSDEDRRAVMRGNLARFLDLPS